MNKPSYNKEALKAMSFETFKRVHKDKNIDYFRYFTDEDWEKEYEEITGKKVTKVDKKEKGE